MRTALERCSIVVLGAWNRAIFTPQWVGRWVFPGQKRLDLGFGVGPDAAVLQLTANGVRMTIAPGRLQANPLDMSPTTLAEAEQTMQRVLEKLAETPIAGVGLNFAFTTRENAEVSALRGRLFGFDDQEALVAATAADFAGASINRQLRLGGSVLNVSIQTSSANGSLEFDFNRHTDVPDAAGAAAAIGGHFAELAERSRSLLVDVYQITPEVADVAPH